MAVVGRRAAVRRRAGPKDGRVVRLPGTVRMPEKARRRQVHAGQVRRSTRQARHVSQRDSVHQLHRRDVLVSCIHPRRDAFFV